MRFTWIKHLTITLFALACLVFVACDEGKSQNSPIPDGDSDLDQIEGDADESAEGEAELSLHLIDIVPFCRLDASETKREFFPWPIESKDAIATIRDDNPETSWKIPEDSETMLTVDLQPWLHGQAVLENASMITDGEIRKLTVELLDACQGQILQSLVWEETGEEFDLAGLSAGCIQLRFQTKEQASLKSLKIKAWVPESFIQPEPDIPTDAIAPLFPKSGVIEGFYGVPWSWSERHAMIERMAATGLGTYLYCPKWDDKHRASWRETYLESEKTRFQDLFEYSNELEVRFLFGISPFIDFDASDEVDFDILRDKATEFIQLGAGGIGLLADDIEFDTEHPVNAEMAATHVSVANRLFTHLQTLDPTITMMFVPTVYSDERIGMFDDGFGYLNALEELDDAISIMWTGPGTSNLTMTGSDLAEFMDVIDRKPVIWDNFWANDGGDGFTGRILLGAFSGRDETLIPAVSGVMHNASIQGGLSRLTIGSFAAFMQAPDLYETSKGRNMASELEGKNGIRPKDSNENNIDTLRFVMELFDGHAQEDTGHRKLEAAIESLIRKLKNDSDQIHDEIFDLLPLFGRMAAIRSEVHHSALAPDLVDELAFPLRKIQYEGEMGLWSLRALAEKLSGESGTDALLKAEEARERSIENRFLFSGGIVAKLLDTISTHPVSDRNVTSFSFSPPDQMCVTEESWDWLLNENDIDLSVFGLADVEVNGKAIAWQPDHSGFYRTVVVGMRQESPPGWGFEIAEFVCESIESANEE